MKRRCDSLQEQDMQKVVSPTHHLPEKPLREEHALGYLEKGVYLA